LADPAFWVAMSTDGSDRPEENGDLSVEEEEMPLMRQKAEIEKNDNADQIRDQIRQLRDENQRLKEQLLKFVVREGQNEASQSGTTIGDNSESLYQMLQEYMVENQNLKEENENLKSERDDFSTRLEREQTTNEKITQEVVAYLANSNRNHQTSALIESLRQTHIQPWPPFQYPSSHGQYIPYHQMPQPSPRYVPDEYVYYNRGTPHVDQWRYTNPNPPSKSSSHTPRNTSVSRLPDIALQAVGPARRGNGSRRPQRENSSSRIPRLTSDRNAQYGQLHQLNAKAQKDINEINRQIKLYKKLNKSQR